MKIGINLLSIDPNYSGGVTSFTFGILNGLIINEEIEIQLYAHKRNKNLFKDFINHKNVTLIELDYGRFRNFFSKICILLFPDRVNFFINSIIFKKISKIMDKNSAIIYNPSATLINFNNTIPVIVSMHDIQHVHFPEYFSFLRLQFRKKSYFYTAKYADYIQASSTFIGKDFTENYSFLKRENIYFISEGVSKSEFDIDEKVASKLLDELGILQDYIFYPAQLWHHKDHVTVLESLKILRDKYNLKIKLVLTGDKFSSSSNIFDFINKYELNDQVLYLGKVPFKTLVALYKKSKFLITATLYESSSLPILEAAASKTSIIASDTPPNLEMGNNLLINFFNAKDPKSLSETIYKIWNDKYLREEQIEYNFNNLDRYLWVSVANEYLKMFQDIKRINE